MSVFPQPVKTLSLTERLAQSFLSPLLPSSQSYTGHLNHLWRSTTPALQIWAVSAVFSPEVFVRGMVHEELSPGHSTFLSSFSSCCALQHCSALAACLPPLPFFHATEPMGSIAQMSDGGCWVAEMGKSPQVSVGLGSLAMSFLMARTTDVTNIMCY